MADIYANILKAGLQANYEALPTKDNNVLYFCTDTLKIYKGDSDFTNNIIVAATKPESPVTGKIYVLADTNTVEVFVSNKWKVISRPMVTSISINSDDNHTASAKAIYDAIQLAVEDVTSSANYIKSVEAGSVDGKIKIAKGDSTSAEITVPGGCNYSYME